MVIAPVKMTNQHTSEEASVPDSSRQENIIDIESDHGKAQ